MTPAARALWRRGDRRELNTRGGVSPLSLRLRRGSQQISSPRVVSPQATASSRLCQGAADVCLVLPHPRASCGIQPQRASPQEGRNCVSLGQKKDGACSPRRAWRTRQGWLFPRVSAWLSADKSSAGVSLSPRRKSEACFCTAVEEHYRFILFHTHSPLPSLPSNPS